MKDIGKRIRAAGIGTGVNNRKRYLLEDKETGATCEAEPVSYNHYQVGDTIFRSLRDVKLWLMGERHGTLERQEEPKEDSGSAWRVLDPATWLVLVIDALKANGVHLPALGCEKDIRDTLDAFGYLLESGAIDFEQAQRRVAAFMQAKEVAV